ncbi:uncharacterized protein DDB_G0271670-like isoform X2 [Malaya genurostris]|uniref:uncharacterized protein DDB_G0271670-like isoform X2 n=1 Tax=Malaya genurostris TaxID=325434 RepID=UPI0026F39034|nr:uncharacterized protein DDB_G0271670-like isoform X2 [Malaya genurostris]
MIQDPGAGINESPELQSAIKYDRVAYDVHRPPVPGGLPVTPTAMEVDPETPLDMTVRRKDSDRQSDFCPSIDQPNSSNSGKHSSDGPINLNVRPSVITKAPPPPIKKRISSMHSNGEIVIKSAVGDNLSPVNCDVFIEEHFRRSLGNTYASIYGSSNNNNNQPKSAGSDTRNSSTSSSSSISSSSSSANSGCALSTSSSQNTSSGISTAVSGSSNNSLSNFNVSSQLTGITSAARQNQANPQLEIASLLTSKTDTGLLQQETKANQEPGTMQHVRPDSEEEVDDHFAKALGNDTWKMIQKKKMNL